VGSRGQGNARWESHGAKEAITDHNHNWGDIFVDYMRSKVPKLKCLCYNQAAHGKARPTKDHDYLILYGDTISTTPYTMETITRTPNRRNAIIDQIMNWSSYTGTPLQQPHCAIDLSPFLRFVVAALIEGRDRDAKVVRQTKLHGQFEWQLPHGNVRTVTVSADPLHVDIPRTV
jgi:hypothetical protein